MLLDGAKGLEPQTRKLFEVCRMRRLPLFTFVNKMDRPALTPYEIMDQIEGKIVHVMASLCDVYDFALLYWLMDCW
jgi:peptide subunit release factor RF-3